ncbi:MAG: alpha/beta fold hydrolase [Promethearchaeota archaeon]
MNDIEIPPKIAYQDRIIEIEGIKLNYWEEGTGKETLFFIHGFTGNVEEWYFQISHFKKTYKVIAIDLRGHGKSEIEDYEISINDLTEDINVFLEKKGIKKVNLAGHSMGGMVAQLFALNHKDKVSKLVLISTTPGRPSYKLPESFINSIKSMTIDELINYMSKAASIPLEKINPERRKFYKKLQDWSVIRRGKGISIDTYINYLKASANVDLRERLKEITVPTLVVCGDRDQLLTKRNSKYLHANIPNSSLIIFPECGHAPQREYFVEFNKFLAQFLKKGKIIV